MVSAPRGATHFRLPPDNKKPVGRRVTQTRPTSLCEYGAGITFLGSMPDIPRSDNGAFPVRTSRAELALSAHSFQVHSRVPSASDSHQPPTL